MRTKRPWRSTPNVLAVATIISPMMQRLQSGAKKLGVELGEGQLDMFSSYLQELLLWNRRVNLTGITNPEEVIRLHFLDSLTVLVALPSADRQQPLRLLDIGTGAGFPGIPIKIACPSFRLTLLEAIGKKAAFLTHVSDSLKLDQVSVLKGRAEEIAHMAQHRESYDLVVARAVAKMPALVELVLPFVAIGGMFIAQKKGDFQQELAHARGAIEVLGATVEEVRWIDIEELEEPRALVALRKTLSSPLQFPRRPGIPQKRPMERSARP